MAAEISVQDPSGSTIRPGGGLGVPLPSLHNIKENEVPASMFDVYETYARILNNEDMPMPLAAVLALTELIGHSNASTMQQLLESLQKGAAVLKSRSSNPLSLTAGCDLFIRYVTSLPQDSSPRRSFEEHKAELVRQGRKYAQTTAATCRDTIAQHTLGVIKDDSIILTHSYSRVVMHALLHAHKQRRISVYVTEARPRGLGMKTYEALTAAGIPCTVVLDSAVAYVMDKVDLVLVGSEAVVESGGLINAVGSFQAALIAKAAKVPFYALAESYKFLRLFPLSQHDLPYVGGVDRDPLAHDSPTKSRFRTGPTETQKETEKKLVYQAFTDPFLSSYDPPVQGRSILTLPAHRRTPSRDQFNPHMLAPPTPGISRSPSLRGVFDPSTPTSAKGGQFVSIMTKEQLAKNPEVDYTTPDLISLVFTDVGILTPEGVSQFLVGIYAD